MNRKQHATCARMLIAACDGLEESARVSGKSKTQLGDYQNAKGQSYMPADVIVALEAHCGERPYSRAMFEGAAGADLTADLREEASEAVEATAALMGEIRLATKDGHLTATERERLTRRHAAATRELAEVGDLLTRDAG